MKIVKYENTVVKGIAVRTDNASEMNPSTAKIGALWEEFYQQIAPHLSEKSNVFGLYTNYESDHNGAFDVVACSDVLGKNNASSFQIQSGHYLVFKGAGEMPQAVIDLWNKVWEYFESESCEHTRAFTSDFELYKNDKEIEIYISI